MIEVVVEDAAWTEALPDIEAVVRRAAKASLLSAPSRGKEEILRVSGARGLGDVTVLLTNDDAVRDLNARFRGHHAATNVLSFPAPETAAPHLGDIALAYGVCAQEAAKQGKRLEQHLSHLVVHGVLHLLGYDHAEDGEAETMEALERSLCADLGWPDPYANAPALEHHG